MMMTDNTEIPTPLTTADARIINAILDVMASLQGLGFAVEMIGTQVKIPPDQQVQFAEGIKRFSDKRNEAIKTIKALIETHTTE